MILTADLHVHTDKMQQGWHGEEPHRLAPAIVASGLDVVAVTEHKRPHLGRYNEVKERVEGLLEAENVQTGLRRRILILLAVELNMQVDGSGAYHVVHVFEKPDYRKANLPDMPEMKADVTEIQCLSQEAPGLSVLVHPTWKDERANDPATTAALMMDNDLFDGTEIVNALTFARENDVERRLRNSTAAVRNFQVAQAEGNLGSMAALGSSDLHKGQAAMVGRIRTGFRAHRPEDLFEAVRAGSTHVLISSDCIIGDRARFVRNHTRAWEQIRLAA